MTRDVNVAVEMLTERLTHVLNKYAPIKIIQVREKYAPWLSDTTKEAMQQRNLAQQHAHVTKDPERIRAFKNIRNTVTKLIRNDKKSWERSKLDNLTNLSSNLWRNLKDLMSWKTGGPPTQLFHEGRVLSSPKQLATIINIFFRK